MDNLLWAISLLKGVIFDRFDDILFLDSPAAREISAYNGQKDQCRISEQDFEWCKRQVFCEGNLING